jgi:protein-disulfide isomerase
VPFDNFKTVIDAELKRANDVAQAQNLSGQALYEELFKTKTPSQAQPQRPAEPSAPVVVDITGAPLKGNPSAPITIVEFSDFECPFCSKVGPTITQLLADYPGQIKVVFKQLPLEFHKSAPLAAQASLAAHEQGKFWPYHDLLFANQRALTRPDLERYAEQLGLDMGQFNAALNSEKFKAQVDKDLAESQRNGIRGTPHFAINGKRLSGAQPIEKFKALIDAELQR